MQMRVQHGNLGRPMEGRRACETFVEDTRKRVDVCAAVDRLSLDLLGRGVLRRPYERAGPCGAVRSELLDDAEVGKVRAVVRGNEDVGRLHVAVDETACMRGIEGGADLTGDAQSAA